MELFYIAQLRMSGRKLLMEWLVPQIDSGNYDGVEWLDKERRFFKIRWTNFKKPGFCVERDAALFREWAKFRGRYKGDNLKEASAWKINFRCALSGAKNVVELPKQWDSGWNYRVYRIDPKAEDKKLPVPPRSGIRNQQQITTAHSDRSDTGETGTYSDSDRTGETGWSSDSDTGETGTYSDSDIAAIQVLLAQPYHEENQYRMKIIVFYGSLQVQTLSLNSRDGCRIFYKTIDQILDPTYTPGHFGPIYELSLREHPSMATTGIFQNFKDGIIIKADGGNIFVTPLSPVTVFYGQSSDGESCPLNHDKTTRVFNANDFISDIHSYMFSKSQKVLPPLPHTILSFQQWSPKKSCIYNLISIFVYPVWAEEVVERLHCKK